METKLVTLSLPRHVVLKAEQIAEERHSTVSEIVAELVESGIERNSLGEEMNEEEEKRRRWIADARYRMLALMQGGIEFGTNGRGWTREDLYDERLKRYGIS